MESKRFTPPEQKDYEYAYKLAYQLVLDKLAGIDDIEQQCRLSGAQYQETVSKKTVIIRYLNQSYQIALPDIEISPVDSDEEVTLRDRVLILHYFASAKGTPPANRLITFRELPAGVVYFPTFNKRTINPLLKNFANDPRNLVETSHGLGGQITDYGDAAVTINAFSRVPVTIVLWQGDEELAPQGNMLFDASISDYLSTEDVTVLCEIITWRLIRLSRET
ncbi:DUF3786 domain-containing protein [Chloroflexota bacterium]